MGAVVVYNPIEVVSELAALYTDQERIHSAVLAGEEARTGCTKHHPPSAAGLYAYFEVHRAYRDLHVRPTDGGWTADDSGNFSVCVAPDGSFAVAVASGDAATGNPHAMPKTAWDKGLRTEHAIDRNVQLILIEERIIAEAEAARLKGRLTWFLLRHRNGDTVSVELSLPQKFENKRVVDWKKRIILEPLRLAPDPMKSHDNSDDIVVDVVRRRS